MAKRLPEKERREEILNACAKLYQEKGFRDITIRDISTETSFSRPSIYNYFETKEEIFLGLLTREYEMWTDELIRLAGVCAGEKVSDPARTIAGSLVGRETLLKITAMNLYEIEDHSRMERLVEFKTAFRTSMDAFDELLKAVAPGMTEERAEHVRMAFFPFLYGIYPYAFPTDKQLEAMEKTGIKWKRETICGMAEGLLRQVL